MTHHRILPLHCKGMTKWYPGIPLAKLQFFGINQSNESIGAFILRLIWDHRSLWSECLIIPLGWIEHYIFQAMLVYQLHVHMIVKRRQFCNIRSQSLQGLTYCLSLSLTLRLYKKPCRFEPEGEGSRSLKEKGSLWFWQLFILKKKILQDIKCWIIQDQDFQSYAVKLPSFAENLRTRQVWRLFISSVTQYFIGKWMALDGLDESYWPCEINDVHGHGAHI